MNQLAWVAVATVGTLALAPASGSAQAKQGFTTPSAPGSPPAASAPDPDDNSAARVTVGGTTALGRRAAMAGAELGVVLRPSLAIVGSAAKFVFAGCDPVSGRFLGAGVRLRSARLFLDAQIGVLHVESDLVGSVIELGVDLVKDRFASLDLHLSLLFLTDGGAADAEPMAGLGLHLYF